MRTVDDYGLDLTFAVVELGAESGVVTGKSQFGSQNDGYCSR